MTLAETIRELSVRIEGQLEHITTEEATKNALVMPLISALGYDIFDPTEIVPEYIADVGTKQGEKVDYAVMQNGTPVILIECKKARTELDVNHASQLFRYFTTTKARIGILTNGITYRFFSDLDEPNKMDTKPFFEFDILNCDDTDLDELERFTKSSFDLQQTLEAASELKYTREMKRILFEELRAPSEGFVRFLAGQVYSGRMTQQAKEQFSTVTKRAFQEFVNERISARLKSALANESVDTSESEPEEVEIEPSDGIVTTEEEIEGYLTIKAILRGTVDVERVTARDTKSYCGILLDDNNRKPICRLHFNRSTKYLGLFDEKKQEERVLIEGLDDIYNYAERLIATVQSYD